MPLDAKAYYQTIHGSQIVAVKILAGTDLRIIKPYHIALLLDTSGSMDEEGLPAVIVTLHRLLDMMEDGNYVTIITYCEGSTIVTQETCLNKDNRGQLHHIVSSFTADGHTNLESALHALAHVVDEAAVHVDSVFLLTDGHVNSGMIHADRLVMLAQECVVKGSPIGAPVGTTLPRGRIPINTLGFGSNHNAAMLRDIALKTHGSYTYADTIDMIPAMIGDIVGGLVDMVGYNCRIHAPVGFKCLEWNSTDEPANECFMGHLVAEKPMWALFRPPEGWNLAVPYEQKTLAFSYDTSAKTEPSGPQQGYLGVIAIESEAPNPVMIVEQYERLQVAASFRRVSALLEREQVPQALTELTRLQHHLETSPARATTFVRHLGLNVSDMITRVNQSPSGSMDSMATRLISNTTTLTTQQGFISRVDSSTDDPNESSVFSTPRQRRTTQALSVRQIPPKD